MYFPYVKNRQLFILVMSDYLLSVASVQFIKANPKPIFEKLVF